MKLITTTGKPRSSIDMGNEKKQEYSYQKSCNSNKSKGHTLQSPSVCIKYDLQVIANLLNGNIVTSRYLAGMRGKSV